MRALLTNPEGVPEAVAAEFEATWDERRRAYVMASMKGMFCTNLSVNLARSLAPGDASAPKDSCTID